MAVKLWRWAGLSFENNGFFKVKGNDTLVKDCLSWKEEVRRNLGVHGAETHA